MIVTSRAPVRDPDDQDVRLAGSLRARVARQRQAAVRKLDQRPRPFVAGDPERLLRQFPAVRAESQQPDVVQTGAR